MNPIDGPSLPASDGAVVKVVPCAGCLGMPHGSVNKHIACLEQALKKLRGGLVLPGWLCSACGVFTGDMKGMTECRCCGAPR
jgi:hypothetical protein